MKLFEEKLKFLKKKKELLEEKLVFLKTNWDFMKKMYILDKNFVISVKIIGLLKKIMQM